MVKVKCFRLHLMLAIDACLRGSNDCFDETVYSLTLSKPKNAKVKAAASIFLSWSQRWHVGARSFF